MLEDLLHLAGPVPLALAVIPALARADLADALAAAPSVAVLQHGWRHENRARLGRKSEYPSERPLASVVAEFRDGRVRLAALFGARALPIFVPPWNRIAPEWLPLLAESGFAAASALASPAAPLPPPGIAAVDVHVDLTDWRGDRGFVGIAAALGRLIAALRVERLGGACRPVGILSHHLIMDRATAGFVDRLAAMVDAHGAARWAGIAELSP